MKKIIILLFTLISLKAQESHIELKSLYSPTLSATKEFNIFFPEGYDSETNRYPVVYLFRGAVDEWTDPTEDAARKGNIKTVFDSLYSAKKIGKMILIMPGLNAPATQNEYTYIVNDLIPYIDAHFRTIPTRWQRAMDGFSLGGTVVTNLLSTVPQLFCSVGSYDGTLNSPYFDNTKFSNASSELIYQIKQVQLLYHTGSVGGNNNTNNQAVFNILNTKGIYNSLPSFLLNPDAQHNWFYADLHIAITLPLHWSKVRPPNYNVGLDLKTNLMGQTLSGIIPIEWRYWITSNTMRTYLFYSKNNGRNWNEFYSTTDSNTSFQWNTTLMPDGTRYWFRIITAGDSLYGSVYSGRFTINNPGNGSPDVDFVNLNEGITISGNYLIQWSADDADGDALSLSLEVSYNSGVTWNIVMSGLANTGSYSIDSQNLANGKSVMFRLSCSDGTITTQAISAKVNIYNKRLNLVNAFFDHISGKSDVILRSVALSDSLRSANYTISFKENGGKKTYSVFNINGIEVVKEAIELDGKTEGPSFDGFRLLIEDLPAPIVNVDSSRWIIGSSNLKGEVQLIDINDASGTITAKPFPSDYEIRVSNTIVDTTLALYGAIAQPVNFLVWNTTLNRKTKFIFGELDGNGILSEYDELYFIEKDSLNNQLLTWHVQFIGSLTTSNPVSGDKFRIKIMKPLTKEDSYRFIYYPPLAVNDNAAQLKDFSLSQNYPNPFNPSTTIEFSIPKTDNVNITIFNLLGQKLQTLIDQKISAGSHQIIWNAEHYSSGIYFYRIHSPYFTQTKKMILAK